MAETERPDDMAVLTREGAVAVLTMNYPARRNAFCTQMREQIYARLEAVMADPSYRAIVLTGAGGHFCSGGDLSEAKPRSLSENRLRWHLNGAITRILSAGPKPVVGAVEGYAMGAGLSLAAICDYTVAARSAKFGAAFAKVGLLPDIGALWSVPRRVGFAKARELFGLARQVDAEEALRIGLVNAVAEPGGALAAALKIADEYAELPPIATALLRSIFTEGVDTYDAALRAEAELAPVALSSRDYREAAQAFLEKRKPAFTGE